MQFIFKKFRRSKKIPLTRPLKPDLWKFYRFTQKIFNSRMLTNRSLYVIKLEEELEKKTKSNGIILTSNGTSALEAILKATDVSDKEKNEIIVPAFTFVATVSAIISSGYKPIFVDVKFNNGTIDPEEVAKLISKKTLAIMGVHIYGNPCDHERLMTLASENNLQLFYDASHAFAVIKKGIPIINLGNASALSFHATKIFTTCEGGAVIANNKKHQNKIRNYINHGISSIYQIQQIGTNAKMSEIHAAYGLSVLDSVPNSIKKRKLFYEKYKKFFKKFSFEIIPFLDEEFCDHNYIYAPFLFHSQCIRDALHDYLRGKNIFVKKYFYPLIIDIPAFNEYCVLNYELENSKKLSRRILCLPLYESLSNKDIQTVLNECELFLNSFKEF